VAAGEVGEEAAGLGERDPYREIAQELGISVSAEPRTKPPCCEPAGDPPVDAELVAKVEGAFATLTQRERRQRSRR